MIRVDNENADRTFNEAWKDPNRPPWDVRDNPIEYGKIAALAPHLAGVRTVLDCGCGGGDFLDMVMTQTGAQFEHVTGYDIADGALERARRTGRYTQLVRGVFDEAPRKLDRTFDLVLMVDALYYAKDYVLALSEIADLVAPGGKMFVCVAMGRNYYGQREITAMVSILAARGLEQLEDREVDYRALGVPRRRVPGHHFLWGQTHKRMFMYRRPTTRATTDSIR